jgi:hypothetical protein
MKRIDLIRMIEAMGCQLVRHGAKHDWYRNLNTGAVQPVPRHREINEPLAKRYQNTEQPSGCGWR